MMCLLKLQFNFPETMPAKSSKNYYENFITS